MVKNDSLNNANNSQEKMNSTIKPVSFNGINIYPFTSKEQLLEYISQNNKIYIAMNIAKIENPSNRLKKIINNNIGYPDGLGALLALKFHDKHVLRIPGIELWIDLIKHLEIDKSYYLIGGYQNDIEQVVSKLLNNFPRINIAGFSKGYFNSEKEKTILYEDILKKKPDVIFVALGSPNQEYFMEKLYSGHPAVYIGLGGSFDSYIGKQKRTPDIIIRFNLEWLYRWFANPIKRTKQNTKSSILFLKLLIKYLYYKFIN